MIRILIPSMGTSAFFKDSFFPKPLYENHSGDGCGRLQ